VHTGVATAAGPASEPLTGGVQSDRTPASPVVTASGPIGPKVAANQSAAADPPASPTAGPEQSDTQGRSGALRRHLNQVIRARREEIRTLMGVPEFAALNRSEMLRLIGIWGANADQDPEARTAARLALVPEESVDRVERDLDECGVDTLGLKPIIRSRHRAPPHPCRPHRLRHDALATLSFSPPSTRTPSLPLAHHALQSQATPSFPHATATMRTPPMRTPSLPSTCRPSRPWMGP
jgi:hypothetical protein